MFPSHQYVVEASICNDDLKVYICKEDARGRKDLCAVFV